LRGLGRLVDGRDGGDTYNYSPPAEDLVIDRPDRVEVTALESGPCAPRADRRDLHVATHALGDERSCSRRAETPCRSRRTRPWSSAPANGSSASTRSWTIPAVTIGCGPTSRYRRRSRGARGVRVRRGRPRPDAEGGPNEFGLDVRVAALRRRFGRSGRPLDRPRRTAGVQLSRTTGSRATRWRSRCCARRYLPLQLRCGRARRVPVSARGPADARRRTFDYALLPTVAMARTPTCTTPPTRCSSRSSASGGWRGGRESKPTARELRCGRARVGVLREPAGCWRACSTVPAPSTASSSATARPPRADVDLVGRPVERFEGAVELRPWEIASLRVDDAIS